MYINSGLENSDIHKSLVNVTGLDRRLALSILEFVNLHGGCIAGSCSLAMYLERNNMPSFRPGDIDIYIPSRQSRTRVHYLDTKEMPWTHRPFLCNIDTEREYSNLSEDFGHGPSHWGDIDKMFVTEFSKHYQRVGGDIYKGTTDSYYLQITHEDHNFPKMGHLPNMDNLTTNEKEEVFGLLWTKISSFKRRGGLQQRYIGDTYRYNGRNYDCSSPFEKNKTWCSVPPGQQEIQLIFLKENVDVHKYIAKNYDFSVCKVYTSLQALKQEHKLVSLHEESIKNRVLDIPNNWEYITIAACFKTVTRRFIKYTQRGFIPMHYKAFETPLLKKQAIYDAMKKSSMKFNAGIVSDSVKMREESLKKLIEKDYNDAAMTGWTNVEQEESLTPLADSYKRMTILLKFYLYQKIIQVYEQKGEEPFSEEQANGIYTLLHLDINDLIDDFRRFDMVEFWNKSHGKSILIQISNKPNFLTFSDQDLILSKSILTSFLEDIQDFLGKTMWFLYDKMTTRRVLARPNNRWNRYDFIPVDDSKDDMSQLSEELDVYNDDGSVKDKYSQAEFIAQIHEPIANRVYRARAQASADKEDPGDINLDAEYLMREGHLPLSDYENSDLSAEIRRRNKGSTGEVNYDKDPDNIHMKTLIGNIENLQGLGTHNKETVVRNIRSHLKGGRRKKLMRFIMKDS